MGLGLEVGVGEGVEAVGLSGFVCCGNAGFVWVGICLGWGLTGFVWVGIWLGFALSCVFGCGGCGGCVVVAVGCWQKAVDCVDENQILF